ncbi:MAG: hypothetical protein QW046_05815 [Candidatus Micrarchaeaceae archaeon]
MSERISPTGIVYTDSDLRNLVVSSAVEIAEEMLRMDEKTKAAIAKGVDGEGKEFFFISSPNRDQYPLSEEERIELMILKQTEYEESKKDNKVILEVWYNTVIGFIRFPSEIVASFPEGKVTPSNYIQIRDRVAAELRNNPEKWIRPV